MILIDFFRFLTTLVTLWFFPYFQSVLGTGIIYYNLLNEIYKGTQPIFLQASQPLHIREETPRSNEGARHRSNGMPQIIYTNNSVKDSSKQSTLVSKPTNSITRPTNLNPQLTNPIILQSHPINRLTKPITLQPNSISGPTHPIILQSSSMTRLPNSIHLPSNKIARPTNPIERPTKPLDQPPNRMTWPSSSITQSANEISPPPASVTPAKCHHTICKIHHHMDTLKTLSFPNIRRLVARPKLSWYPRPVYEHNFPIFDVNLDAANYLT